MQIIIDGDVSELAEQIRELHTTMNGPVQGFRVEGGPPEPAPFVPPEPRAAAPGAPTGQAPDGAAPELDVHGRPWNEAIHTKTRSKNADESWRYKRSVDKALVAQIETGAAAPVVAAPVNPLTIPPSLLGAAVQPAPLVPAPPVAPPLDPVTHATQLAVKMLEIAGQHGEAVRNEIGVAITAVMVANGVPTLEELVARPECAPQIVVGLQALAQQRGIPC